MLGFYNFLAWLAGTFTEEPGNYGWFHIMFVVIVVAATGVVCHFFKNADDKTYRRIVLITWIIIVLFEVYKEIIFSFDINEEDIAKSTWEYQWYAFPYQLCSTPLYVLPLIAFLPDSNKVCYWIRRACMYFTATFAFFGGFVVYVYPNDVFIPTIGICIQTMVHHGSQVLLGIYTAVYMRKNFKLKEAWTGVAAFAVLALIAIILNETMIHVIPEDNTFNMFYISRHFDCTLPVLSGVYKAVPYGLFLPIYLLGFTLVGAIIFFSEKGIMYLVYRKERAEAKENAEA
jgi:hypothetical protein